MWHRFRAATRGEGAKFGEGYSGAFGQSATNTIQLFESSRGSQPDALRTRWPMAPLDLCRGVRNVRRKNQVVPIARRSASERQFAVVGEQSHSVAHAPSIAAATPSRAASSP